MQRFMAERGLAAEYACPALPPLANDAISIVEKSYVEPGTCFIGSSLGGFYATYLAERHGLKAVLINPAIDPHVGLRAYLGALAVRGLHLEGGAGVGEDGPDAEGSVLLEEHLLHSRAHFTRSVTCSWNDISEWSPPCSTVWKAPA